MKFRDLPALKRRSGMMSWPPHWSSMSQSKENWPRGESGTLDRAWMQEPLDQCVFLSVTHDGLSYTGSMYFDDYGSALMIFDILKSAGGRSIAEIADLEVSYFL